MDGSVNLLCIDLNVGGAEAPSSVSLLQLYVGQRGDVTRARDRLWGFGVSVWFQVCSKLQTPTEASLEMELLLSWLSGACVCVYETAAAVCVCARSCMCWWIASRQRVLVLNTNRSSHFSALFSKKTFHTCVLHFISSNDQIYQL